MEEEKHYIEDYFSKEDLNHIRIVVAREWFRSDPSYSDNDIYHNIAEQIYYLIDNYSKKE